MKYKNVVGDPTVDRLLGQRIRFLLPWLRQCIHYFTF